MQSPVRPETSRRLQLHEVSDVCFGRSSGRDFARHV